MYGNLKWADYYCGRCGAYRIESQTHTGIRGETRCNICNQQARETARVTQEVIQKRKGEKL